MLETPLPETLFSGRRRESKHTLRVLFLLTTWYISSSVAVVLTKILFSGSRTHRPFPFGLTVTATNNFVASALASLVLNTPADIKQQPNVNRIALIIGCTTAAEIGLSNFALILLSVSYATVLKGMAPLFVMAWGVIFGLHQLQLGILSAFIAIAVGMSFTVAGETITKSEVSNFVSAGFWAQFCSALLSGFRWMLTQVFIQGRSISDDRVSSLFNIQPMERGLSAVETIWLTAPFTLLCVFPFLVLLEGPGIIKWFLDAHLREAVVLITGLTVIGSCVYLLLWSEYELVKVTSSLTVSVGFVMKEVVTLFAGVVVFNDKLSGLTVLGFVIVQCGVIGYAMQKKKQEWLDSPTGQLMS